MDIAALLHVHREHVEHRREQALERLTEDLGADSGAEVAALVGQSVRADDEAPSSSANPCPQHAGAASPTTPLVGGAAPCLAEPG